MKLSKKQLNKIDIMVDLLAAGVKHNIIDEHGAARIALDEARKMKVKKNENSQRKTRARHK